MSALLSKISSLQGYSWPGWRTAENTFKNIPDTFYSTEVGKDSDE